MNNRMNPSRIGLGQWSILSLVAITSMGGCFSEDSSSAGGGGVTEQTLQLDAGTVVVTPSTYSIPAGCDAQWEMLVADVWALQQCVNDADCEIVDVPRGAPTGLPGELCCDLPLGVGMQPSYLHALDRYYADGCRPSGQNCAQCYLGEPTCVQGKCVLPM